MSTDSDDEDELLQMALKEQTARDLRPPSSSKKPVENFKGAEAKRMAEDSELEMLSISSGDEEVSKESHGQGKARERSVREDEGGWDGEEPDCWKRVDEAELAGRVREMRETRTAPVAQKFEKKPSVLVKKGLNNLQSFPRGMECIDPLGLGIIDNKSLRLITESSESSPSKSDRRPFG